MQSSRGEASRRSPSHAAWLPGALVVAAVVTTAGLARVAHADDRAAAEALLQGLPPGVADEPAKHARDALERATRMRGADDATHARLAEGLALEWARAADEAARTSKAEAEAHASALAADEAVARVDRERALLEEAIARAGRMKAELAAATRSTENPERRPAGRRDAAATKATKPAPLGGAAKPNDADAPAHDGGTR